MKNLTKMLTSRLAGYICTVRQHGPFKEAVIHTVNPVLSGHSKLRKIKILKPDGGLMQVESIAECSLGAFCNNFDVH